MAGFRADLAAHSLVVERRKVAIGRDHDVATAPTIAAIGPTARYELLAPHTHIAVAAVAGAGGDRRLVDERFFGIHGFAAAHRQISAADE